MEDRLEGGRGVTRSMEHWRGVTLRMGLLYEKAAVQFWGEVAASVRAGDRSRSVVVALDDVDDPGLRRPTESRRACGRPPHALESGLERLGRGERLELEVDRDVAGIVDRPEDLVAPDARRLGGAPGRCRRRPSRCRSRWTACSIWTTCMMVSFSGRHSN